MHILRVSNFDTGVLLKLCSNHYPDTASSIPEQMKRSYYHTTERVTTAIQANNALMPVQPYEQPFPGYEEDFQYMTRMYPFRLRDYVPMVRNTFDAMEYKGSLLYDRYPDRDALLRIATEITGDNENVKDLTVMLMLHELMLRRERYRQSQKD